MKHNTLAVATPPTPLSSAMIPLGGSGLAAPGAALN